ncbi:ribonuclease-like [Pelodiscus sinensis]|uniref:ribonuclease-like n=1 Tax=Pelodiscus sinensis TaxID=13735 RepID=UPI003F6C97A4
MAHPMLLLAWLAVGLALAQGQTYRAFKRQHIDYPRTRVNPYCNRMMQRRGMTTPCKGNNTFIHARTTDIINVCGSGGTPVRGTNRQISIRAFTLTNCRLRGIAPNKSCSYEDIPSSNHIRIACDPVHFDRRI